MRSGKPNNLALILLGAALLPWLACSQKSAEVAAAPSPAPSGGSASTPAASGPASDSGFTVSGPLIVEHQLDVLAQRDGVIAELRSEAGAHVRAGTYWRSWMTGNWRRAWRRRALRPAALKPT